MVKSDNVVPCKYVSASPLAQNFVRKVIFFLLVRVSPLSIGPTFPKVRRILAHICQIEWNLISFDDGNDKRPWINIPAQKKKSEHLLVNDSCPVRPVW